MLAHALAAIAQRHEQFVGGTVGDGALGVSSRYGTTRSRALNGRWFDAAVSQDATNDRRGDDTRLAITRRLTSGNCSNRWRCGGRRAWNFGRRGRRWRTCFVRSCRSGSGRRTWRGTCVAFANDGNSSTNENGFSFGHQNLEEYSRTRRGHFGVNFVGGDFVERFIAFNTITDVLHPPSNNALGNGFA